MGSEGRRTSRCDGILLLDDSESTLNQAKLALLMSQRTFYSVNRQLSLGSIIFDGKDYFLCVQPACDCVRLTGWTPFPVLKLVIAEKGFHIVLVDDNKVIGLETDFKPSSVSLIYFRADSRTGSVEGKCKDDHFFFRGGASVKGAKRDFRFVGQLKIEQALRCVAKITTQLGRVGLTESVWARVMAK